MSSCLCSFDYLALLKRGLLLKEGICSKKGSTLKKKKKKKKECSPHEKGSTPKGRNLL